MVAVRCCWMTVPTSTPGTLTASASLIASSSRGGWVRGTGEVNHDDHLVAAGLGHGVHHVALAVGPLALDQPVALQTRQGRVDLPDVQRPGATGAVLELRPQLVAVARALLEQGQQSVAHRHRWLPSVIRIHGPRDHGYGVCIRPGYTRYASPIGDVPVRRTRSIGPRTRILIRDTAGTWSADRTRGPTMSHVRLAARSVPARPDASPAPRPSRPSPYAPRRTPRRPNPYDRRPLRRAPAAEPLRPARAVPGAQPRTAARRPPTPTAARRRPGPPFTFGSAATPSWISRVVAYLIDGFLGSLAAFPLWIGYGHALRQHHDHHRRRTVSSSVHFHSVGGRTALILIGVLTGAGVLHLEPVHPTGPHRRDRRQERAGDPGGARRHAADRRRPVVPALPAQHRQRRSRATSATCGRSGTPRTRRSRTRS